MIATLPQHTLFTLPEALPHPPRRGPLFRILLRATHVHQRRLWIDLQAPVGDTLTPQQLEFRQRLKDIFTDGVLPLRTRELAHTLVPLLSRVSYTQALACGVLRLFVEYRACDKLPHYRLTLGGLFYGRVDIHLDTVRHGANIHACETLPQVRDRLAAYCVALGVTATTAYLEDHQPDESEAENTNIGAREYRLFKFNAFKEQRRERQL